MSFLRIDMARGTVWHPGDAVEGTVVLTSTEQIDVESIEVEFEGRIKAKQQQNSGHIGVATPTAKISLFHESTTLFKGPYTLPSTTRKWPFRFQFPSDCRAARRWGAGTGGRTDGPQGSRVFDLDPNQPLPPSMIETGDNSMNSETECVISYQVTAKCIRSGTFKTPLESIVPLKFTPYRSSAHPIPDVGLVTWSRPFSIKSYYLDPRLEDRPLTFKEKMKSTLHSKDIPEFKFELEVNVPTVAIIGQNVPIFLGVKHASTGDATAKQIPEVYLTSYKIILDCFTYQMVERSESPFAGQDHVMNLDSSTTLDHWKGKVAVGGGIDLSQMDGNRSRRESLFKNSPYGGHFVPTFRSFLVSRSYRLKVEGSIECARETEHFISHAGHTSRINILAPVNPEQAALEATSTAPPDFNDPAYLENAGPSDELPSYKSIMKS
jgi:hypothetical protein